MSYYGRKAVAFDLERRWAAGHRAGKVHPWERSRILNKDYGPIIRELKPEIKEGVKFVLSKTRPRGALVRDPLTMVEILYPKPPAEDLFWIIVRDVVRHRAGYWRVRFDVFDRRETDFYVRSKPPVYTQGDGDGEPAEDEQVRIDSAYTTNPEQALDHLSAVDRFTQRRITLASRDRQRLEIEDKLAAMREIRDVLDAKVKADPGLTTYVGKYLWQIRGRIDATEKALKRRIAA